MAYEIWETHTVLGAMRAKKEENWYFGQFFPADQTFLVEDEWIDLEKLPIEGRLLAPFVKPLGRGSSVYVDSSRHSRFKPAYAIVEETLSPLDGLSVMAGVDPSMVDPRRRLSILERRRLLKALKAQQARKSIERRWEWMRAKAITDGKVTVDYKDGESVLVDFRRDADHTEVLTSGNKWGDSGVSILGHVERVVDTMSNAEFGGVPVRATMGGAVASVVREDEGIMKHLDKNTAGGVHVVDRGLTPGTKIYKFGELTIGGASGQKIELWVNNETYGTNQRYVGANDVVFTGTTEAIMGYSCYGRIIDQDADYQAMPIFPKNLQTGDDVKTEHMTFKSAPLMIPINPDATYKATVL